MYLLAVDTSSMHGSLCLFRCEKSSAELVATKEWGREAQHSDRITAALEELLSEAKLKLSDLSLLAVNHGPGSFTGIRVGINLVRSLSYCFNLPVIVANSFEIMKAQNSTTQPGLKVFSIYAFRNLLYVSGFNLDSEVIAPQAVALNELSNLLKNWPSPQFYGTGWALVGDTEAALFTQHHECFPLARDLGPLALKLFQEKRQVFKWIEVTPLYIRNSEAEEKLKNGLLKPASERNIKGGNVPNS